MNLGVSYIPEHLPHHIEDDLKHMADIGCNEVLFALQENTFNAVDGAVRFGAELARKYNLTPFVVIWGFANTFGGGRNSDFMLKNLDAWRMDTDGKPLPMACMRHQGVVDEFARLVQIGRDMGFEGFFVDEPMRQNCFCPACTEAFQRYSDTPMKEAMDEWNAWMNARPEWYVHIPRRGEVPIYGVFQNDLLGEYVRSMCNVIKGVDGTLATTACVFADDHGAWDALLSIDSLDVFAHDPYWLLSNGTMTIEHAVKRTVALKEAAAAHGKQSQVWLNCWSLPVGVEKEMYNGGRALAEAGCDSLYTWSYRAGLGTTEECKDAKTAWAYLTQLYRELSGLA